MTKHDFIANYLLLCSEHNADSVKKDAENAEAAWNELIKRAPWYPVIEEDNP